MKKLFVLSLLWFAFTTTLLAQSKTVEKTLPIPASNIVELQLKFGDQIKIAAWDKKEVYVKVIYEINSGKLNNALQLKFSSDQEKALVSVDLDQELAKTGKAEDCPDKQQGIYNSNKNGSYTCMTINYEVFVPRNADLTVKTINGNIELRGVTGPVNAKSISGFVDMNWPEKKGAAVALRTVTGEVYSDINLNLPQHKPHMAIGYQLKGNVGEGGATIKLQSISNDIFLRKQK